MAPGIRHFGGQVDCLVVTCDGQPSFAVGVGEAGVLRRVPVVRGSVGVAGTLGVIDGVVSVASLGVDSFLPRHVAVGHTDFFTLEFGRFLLIIYSKYAQYGALSYR